MLTHDAEFVFILGRKYQEIIKNDLGGQPSEDSELCDATDSGKGRVWS
jgi:hypothetical protein